MSNPSPLIPFALGSIFVFFLSASTFFGFSKLSRLIKGLNLPYFSASFCDVSRRWLRRGSDIRQTISDIHRLSNLHETAAVLSDLINMDGAGSWPPIANHVHHSWPLPLRPYKEIYLVMSPYLAYSNASLDDEVNKLRISKFRTKLSALLDERISMDEVKLLLDAAEAGRWDVLSRDVYNAFYSCIAMCRHAYRWSAIPVVRVAQLETVVHLPVQLVEPWRYMQRHFGCTADSGNTMSNIVLNFSPSGQYIYKINVGVSPTIISSEEAFARILYDAERFALPIYHDMIRAIIAFARSDKAACANHVSRIAKQLRPLLSSYYDRMHNGVVAHSAFLSYVQGFYAWSAGYVDEATGELIKFDGLSGNQIVIFQALDAFCGLPRYLDEEISERSIPARQRKLVEVLEKHSFRAKLLSSREDSEIAREFGDIIKRLRIFRTAHRSRSKVYMSQPAPERLLMTAGKSLLESDWEQSLDYLDSFMIGRLAQTV